MTLGRGRIISILLVFLLVINIYILFNIDYGWWLFFSLTLWILIVFLIWHVAYWKFKIKNRFKNPYSLMLINSLFLLFIKPGITDKTIFFAYTWIVLIATAIVITIFLWGDYNKYIRKKKKLVYKKWLSGSRKKVLQLLMVFFILVQAIVIFPYIFEPVLIWKSEQNKEVIKETVYEITKDCENDENKTIMLLNWFERHSSNMFNNYGLFTLTTGEIHPLMLSFGNGNDFFRLFCNLYIRPVGRDYPTWVFTTRSGRCDEHSILFREMASAAGLNVRSVVCREMDHLWAEIKINGNWIVVDPSNVVHNFIWRDANFSGYNLSQYDFIDRFSRPKNISYIFAEYSNQTKEIVTDRYIKSENISQINIATVDENNKFLPNIKVEVLSNNGGNRRPLEFEFITDDEGKYKVDVGKGSLTFHATTDGFLYQSGEVTQIIEGNQSYNINIVLKSDYTNVLTIIFLITMILILILTLFVFKRKKQKKGNKRKRTMKNLNKKRIKIFLLHVKAKRIIIYVIAGGIVLMSLLRVLSVSIDNIVTIILTYALVVATGYYAIVNSRMFRMQIQDRKNEVKPQFAWTLYKLIHKNSANDKIVDIFVLLRNIGRGAAKEIELEIILSHGQVFGYGRLRINPMLPGEERWLHIDGFPLSLDDYSEEDNSRGEGADDLLAIFISYQDVNNKHYPLASTVQTTGKIQYISKKKVSDIYEEAHENHCQLEEKNEEFIKIAKRHREENERRNLSLR